MATVLGSADRDVSVITGNSIGQHSRVNIAGVKATNPSEGHHRKQGQRQAQDEAGSGPGRGRHLDERLSLSFLFYLLLYFHLVVQVMSVGVSLGRGSMKADFLVIKKRG